MRHTIQAAAGSVALVVLASAGIPALAQAAAPIIDTQPIGQTAWAGSNVTFTVAVSGTGPFNYSWKINGTNIFQGATIVTVAGNGTNGYSGDGGAATNAKLSSPAAITSDAGGNIYIADSGNHRIRRVDPDGIITTVAGNGTQGFSGDGAAATNASLARPSGVAVDTVGNLYISDSTNSRIRKVDIAGIITTVAGNGTPGFSGDGGTATNASLGSTGDVAVDAAGNLYFADPSNRRIRKVDTNGVITTVAGNGGLGNCGDEIPAVSSCLVAASYLAVGGNGDIYIGDTGNNRIREVDAQGLITTAVGASAPISRPMGVWVDNVGTIYFAEGGTRLARMVDPYGRIVTVAGFGGTTYGGEGVPATHAGIAPLGINVDNTGSLYIVDSANVRIRKLYFGSPALTLTNVSMTNAGDYTVVVSSRYGSVTSSVATLIVDGISPSILSQPSSSLVPAGGTVSLSVAARGTTPLGYVWYENSSNLLQAGPVSSLTLSNFTVTNAGWYSAVVTNAFGSATSIVATLAVSAPPLIVSQPANQAVMIGGDAAISVAVSGVGPFHYRWYRGTNLIPQSRIVTTIAGTTVAGFAGDGGMAANASLNAPAGVAADAMGNLYIADTSNERIRKVDPLGVISTVAGTGSAGFSGDGGLAANAAVSYPNGLAVDAQGNLYIADTFNNRIRSVDAGGNITTLAGGGGSLNDGQPAIIAGCNVPLAVAVDGSGCSYIADSGNNRVRKVNTRGVISTVFIVPWWTLSSRLSGLALDPYGNLYFSDAVNNCVELISASNTNIVAGTGGPTPLGDGGMATSAGLSSPVGLAVGTQGELYIADTGHSRVRVVDTNGIITTFAGNGTAGFSGDGTAVDVSLSSPKAIAVDPLGTLYIADTANNRVRRVTLGSPTLNLSSVTLDNAGDYTVVITGLLGSTTSTVATLTVNVPARITSQPISKLVFPGSDVTFGVSATGTPPLAYFWQLGTTLVQAGPSPNLAVPAADSSNVGGYTVIASNLFGSVTSRVATLTLAAPPSILTQSSNLLVLSVSNTRLGVSVGGTGPFSYRWNLNGADLPKDIITTFAGTMCAPYLELHGGVAADAAGNLYFADTRSYRVRKVDTNGITTVIAGNGASGSTGDGNFATNASLGWVIGLTVDSDGNCFAADINKHVIQEVYVNGIITTVAGSGTPGSSGDGGAATNATLSSPQSLAVDAGGRLYIADTASNRVRAVDAGGFIGAFAGTGVAGYSGDGGPALAATLNQPEGVASDAFGNLYIGDAANNRVRKVDTSGTITTVAGNGTAGFSGDGGPATNASLNAPFGVAVDAVGNLYIADSNNNRIRKVSTNGGISTVVGNGVPASFGDGGSAATASIWGPSAVALDPAGNLYITEATCMIRKVALAESPVLTLVPHYLGNGGDYTVVVTSPYGSVTSSVINVTVVVPPTISKIVPQPDGSVTLTFSGTPNLAHQVWMTTNLAPPAIWLPVSTNLSGLDGTWQLTDTNAPACPARFYRASAPRP